MSPWLAVIRALPITFLVYVSSTALAAMHALPIALEIGRLPTWTKAGEGARIATLEAMLSQLPVLRAQGLSLLLAALAYALLSPWLQMSWFAALSAPRAPGAALAEGARLTPRAYLTSLVVGIGTVLMLLPCAALVWTTRSWLESRANVRVQDIATLIALTPGALVLFLSLAWHDLARARCLSSGAFRSSLRAWLDALSLVTLARYACWAALGLTISVAAQLASLQVGHSGRLAMFIVLAVVQGAALARSMLRSRWLTDALLCADASPSAPRFRKSSV